jgi:hypothetical protein
MKNKFIFVVIILLFPVMAHSAGSREGAASNRGRYLSGFGHIIQPDEIKIDNLIAQIDYNYPLPQTGAFNVITETDIRNEDIFIQIGIKGKKDTFEDLPPMNISFVIDISGSMAQQDKLSWVKSSFYIFINQIRPQDIISVVIFDNNAEVLIEPTRILNDRDRDRFKRRVDSLRPRGGTDIFKGMTLGYQQVEKNFRSDYTNRVLLLTDGMHNGTGTKDDILSRVSRYNDRGITISTVSLGAAADIDLMVDMAIRGGGSSRFISDHDKMEQTFGSELDRLIVPAARMLRIQLELADGINLKETWGYDYWVDGNVINYRLDSIHNGDYETIMVIATSRDSITRETVVANLSVSYVTLTGENSNVGPYIVSLSNDALRNINSIENLRIKEAEGFIAYGQLLIEIAELAKTISILQQEFRTTRLPETRDRLSSNLNNGLIMISELSSYLEEISLILGGDKYLDELTTLKNYNDTFTNAYNNLST